MSATAALAKAQPLAACHLSLSPASAPAALQTTVNGQVLLDGAAIADIYVLVTYALE